ncbi:MAG: hypothetical protein JJU29_03085 [Verrucomicrobia bacterium]|nr:hypothetical protein [Verrucomicrobiota bacterium]
MKFLLQGKAYHMVLQNAADLKVARETDETLWVATAAPISAFRLDMEFLRYLDQAQDQRIKSGEVKNAVDWLLAVLTDHSGIDGAATDLRPKAVNELHPDGKFIRPLLERIRGDDPTVSLAKIRKWRARLESRPVSEAGVVLPEAAEREDVRKLMEDLLRVMPGAPHPSGKNGVDEATLNNFVSLAKARQAWRAQAASDEPGGRSEVRPLGDDSAAAHAIYLQIRDAIDRFYALCDVVAMNPEALPQLWPGPPLPENTANATDIQAHLRTAPPAKPNPEGLLRIDNRVNPAFARLLHEFRAKLIVPYFDKTDEVLNRNDWNRLRTTMERHGEWKAAEPGPHLAPLGPERVREIAESPRLQDVRNLINTQISAAVDLNQVRLTEKLALFQGHLLEFANNFISFPKLYAPDKRAAFEEGSLILDGRRFNLAVRVPDRAQYLKGVEGGTMFIMILKLEHPRRPEGWEIAVPATSGRQGNLKVGKHGIFQHVDGTEWFATILHIVENPISLNEAMAAPFVRLGQSFTRKVEAITQAAEKRLDQSGELLEAPPPPPPPPPPTPGANGQMLAGGGIAIAALGSSLAFMTKTFAGLTLPQILGGLLVAVLAFLIPSAIIAAIRLNKRDLSVLLEAGGWGINARMRLSRAQRFAFTGKPAYPENSSFQRDRIWWLVRALWIVFAIYIVIQTVAYLNRPPKPVPSAVEVSSEA